MAGYNRNDTVNNIADGNIINASDLDGEFDAIDAAFDETTGHDHDGSSGAGKPITKVGPSQDVVVGATAVTPKTDNTVDLGSSTFEFKDLYIDGTAYIDAIDFNGVAITATGTELNFVDGVTSNIQTQLDNKQPLDAQLTDIAGLTPTDNAVIIGNGTNFVTESGATARASLGLAIGVDVQAYDADLAAFALKTAPTGAVVGTTDTQTLTNKTVNLTSNTLTGTIAQFNTALSDADFATLAGTETLTNKTIALGSNTVSGTIAQFNTAVTDADFATLAGTETLTNKTIDGASNTLTNLPLANITEPVRHSVRPSLLLDFANTKTLDPRITFTRGSTGTFYDGKTVAKAEENFIYPSEDFTSARWGKTNLTATANTAVAPDGTTTADTLDEGTATGTHRTFNSGIVAVGTVMTFSVYLKYVDRQYVQVKLNSSNEAGVVVDMTTGTIASNFTTTGWTINSYSSTSVGNGWYRVVVTGSKTSGTEIYGVVALSDSSTAGNDYSYTGTSKTVYVWGAQLEARSSVTAYTATTTAPITNYIPALQTAASGVARFEHNPVTGESLGLEIEEQRTNLLTRSEEFGTTWTATNITVTANQIIAPDGTLTADQLTDNSTSGFHQASQTVSVTSGTAYTLSVYAKRGTTNVSLRLQDGTNFARADFDLSNGTSTLTTGTSASITAVGNGWYRCTLTGTATATTASGAAVVNVKSIFSYVGTGEYVYVWGAQLEAGAFATSYIKTEGATATRSADSASMTGTNFSSWYRADEGTLYAEGVPIHASTRYVMSISDGTSNNRNGMYWNTSAPAQTTIVGGATQANMTVTAGSVGSSVKIVSAYKVNDFSFTTNAVTVATDTSGLIPPAQTTLDIGSSVSNAASWNSTIKKLAYYPRRLTNAELQGLTTV